MKDSLSVCALVFCLGLSSAEATLNSGEERTLQRLVLAEAGGEGELGMALVARSVLNRTALLQAGHLNPGTYMADGADLRQVIFADGQYQPISDGSFYRARTAAQQAAARRAIALGRDTEALRARLAQAGKSPAAIERLLNATGFRTLDAFYDASQDHETEPYGNHLFNSDRFARLLPVERAFETAFAADLEAFDEEHPYALASLPEPYQQRETERRLASAATPSAYTGPRRSRVAAATGQQGMVQVINGMNGTQPERKTGVDIFFDAMLAAMQQGNPAGAGGLFDPGRYGAQGFGTQGYGTQGYGTQGYGTQGTGYGPRRYAATQTDAFGRTTTPLRR